MALVQDDPILAEESDSDDDFDWEEVEVPDITQQQPEGVHQDAQQQESITTTAEDYEIEPGPSAKPNIEITIKTQRAKPSGK